MREAAFVQRNQGKWERLSRAVTNKDASLAADEASSLYIETVDDLSYARTFYPNAPVTAYLNGLAMRLHHVIHRNRKTGTHRLITFWTRELPLVLARTRREQLIALTIFALAVLVGAFSAHHDIDFPRLILGDSYVDMTLENIKRGEPMAVYGSAPAMDMFLGITLNNIRVALITFAFGTLLGFGTWMILLQNGIMLGCFQYFMYQQGVLTESVLSIWIHGVIEIGSILIAGAAGIVIGNGILFPGTYTRLESFKRSARAGMKLAIGLVPCFIAAGFLESFITRRSPDMPVWVSAGIIIGTLALMLAYFVYLPYHVQHRIRSDQAAPAA